MRVLIGIDEVGRGPWAGPLLMGAVYLGEAFRNLPEYAELKDSKKLTPKKREKLAPVVLQNAVATGLGWVSAEEIDRYGLGKSLPLAARRAIKPVLKILKDQHLTLENIAIDGTINFLSDTPLSDYVTILPKADDLVKEVSAASIIAKVARDHYMYELDAKYPGYGFGKHVGYGTAAHRQALADLGVCPEHRLSFRPLRKFSSQANAQTNTKTSTELGREAESLVANYLKTQGHQILAQNYKTKTSEIDLISLHDREIYFTEVKLRGTKDEALAAITAKKQQQMHYAAELFLSSHPNFQIFQPLLAAAAVVPDGDSPHITWLAIQ